MNRHHTNRRPVMAAAAVAAAAVLTRAMPAPAATYTWLNTAGGNFSTPGNFDLGVPPSNDFTTALNFSAGTYTAVADLPGATSGTGGGAGAAGAFDLNSITFANTAANTGGLVTIAASNNGTGSAYNVLTFGGANPTVTLAAGAGSATIAAPVSFAAATAATIVNAGAGGLTFSNVSTGTPATTFAFVSNGVTNITNAGAGTLTLGDGITYSGTNATINLFNANPAANSFQIGNMGPVSGTLNVASGAVTFAGNTGGDLFGNSLILNVVAGASFDFAGNGESMGGITGGGNVLLTNGAGAGFNLVGDRTFSGVFSGTGGVTQNVASVLTLSGNNTYTGATAISAGGTIRVTGPNVLSPGSAITVMGGSRLDTGGFDQAVGGLAGNNVLGSLPLGAGSLTIATAAGGNYTFTSPLTGTGGVTINGAGIQGLVGPNTYTGPTVVNGGTLRLNATALIGAGSTATVAAGATLDDVVPTDTALATGYFVVAGRFAKEGAGNLTLAAPATAAPNFNPSGLGLLSGPLTIDQTADAAPRLPGTPSLLLAAGTLTVVGNGSAASGQTFAGTTLGGTGTTGGATTLVVTPAGGQTNTVALGTVTRSAGATVDFRPGTANGTAAITAANANTNGILGGYATVNGASFATVTGGAIAALPDASYVSTLTTSTASTADVSLSASTTVAASATANALRFTNTAATTVSFTSSATTLQQLTLTSGGILVAPTATAAVTIGGTTAGVRGGLTAPAGQDVIVHQYGTGTLAINSNISGGGLTLTGTGQLNLTGTNTYTGGTYLNGGTLNLPSANTVNLGAAATPVIFNGGTLAIAAGNIGSVTATAHPITVGPAGGTINLTAATASQTITGAGLFGTGTLTKAGPGTLNVGSNASTFAGPVAITGGLLLETSSQLGSANGLTVANGGQFQINDDGVGTFAVASGTPFTISGVGPAATNPGAIALTVQASDGSPVSTITNPVVLAGASTVGVYSTATKSNTAIGFASFLTLSGPVTGTGPLTTAGIAAVNASGGAMNGAGGVLTLSGSNSYTGGTIVSSGTLRVNNTAGSGTGSGGVSVLAGATLGGSGTIGNGANPLVVQGTITAGASNTATGTLTTGAQQWNASGAYVAKLSGDTTANDRLVMSGLTVTATAGSSFVVNVTGVNASSPSAAQYVLAVDTVPNGSTDPFGLGASGTLSAASQLSLQVNGAPTTVYTLSEGPDTTGTAAGGYDLFLSTAAAPEPTSLLLLTAAAAPLALGRRRAGRRA